MTNLEEVINKAVEKSVKEAILAAHPVGSFYFSDNDANPAEVFGGGVWQRIEGAFLFGRDTAPAMGQTVGARGGEYSHTLSVDEMPSHYHRLQWESAGNLGTNGTVDWSWVLKFQSTQKDWAYENPSNNQPYQSIGGSQPHNNMPPYYLTNLWKRIE